MNWHKLIIHDLRRGLFRWRYLLVPIIASISCFKYINNSVTHGISGTWIDILIVLFEGQIPIETNSKEMFQFPMPIDWLFLIGACLFFNLDFFLNDLALTGQQNIVRCRIRSTWFLSKCIWNFFSCIVYFGMVLLTTIIFAAATGSSLSLNISPQNLRQILGLTSIPELSTTQIILVSMVLPLLTLVSLSMLQMTLCLFIKPIISFLGCVGNLVLAIYVPSSFILGNGAMSVRSTILHAGDIDPYSVVFSTTAVIISCIIIGTLRFKHTDLLLSDE